MRTLLGVFNLSALQMWERIPFSLKASVGALLLLATGAELAVLGNQGWFSNTIERGKAAQSGAQASDPDATKAAIKAQQSPPAAERQIAATVFGLEADAEQKQAVADAATESEDELLAKAKRGAKLTSTEKLKLRELQLREREVALREQEIGVKTSENKLKAAEATNAEQKAAVQKMVNNMLLNMQLDKNNGQDWVHEQMKESARRAGLPGLFGR